ncbi:MAG: hypothetical protein JHC87_00560 [Thermoleophilaceae bacterium]|nr:hypothetical protein [Thermoleophilaceae bacterium]
MRPVNLLLEDGRRGSGPTGDPMIAYGIVGSLGLLLVLVLFSIMQTNKVTTLNDETLALQAQAMKYQTKAKPVQSFADFGSEVDKRTLLIGGLAESRFPWHTAFANLSKVTPSDVALDKIDATTAAPVVTVVATPGEEAAPPIGATINIAGCTSGWIGVANYISALKVMPGVLDVTSKSSGSDTNNSGDSGAPKSGADPASSDANEKRKAVCGGTPLTFDLTINYSKLAVDLSGLPKIESAAAAGSAAPGASPAVGAPAAAPATATAGAN